MAKINKTGKTGGKQRKEKAAFENELRQYAASGCTDTKVADMLKDIANTLNSSKEFYKVKSDADESMEKLEALFGKIRKEVASGSRQTALSDCTSLKRRVETRTGTAVADIADEDLGYTDDELVDALMNRLNDDLVKYQKEYNSVIANYDYYVQLHENNPNDAVAISKANSLASRSENLFDLINTTSRRIQVYEDDMARKIIAENMRSLTKDLQNRIMKGIVSDDEFAQIANDFDKAVREDERRKTTQVNIREKLRRGMTGDVTGTQGLGEPQQTGQKFGEIRPIKTFGSVEKNDFSIQDQSSGTNIKSKENVEAGLNALAEIETELKMLDGSLMLEKGKYEKLNAEFVDLVKKYKNASPAEQKAMRGEVLIKRRGLDSQRQTVERYQGEILESMTKHQNVETSLQPGLISMIKKHSAETEAYLRNLGEASIQVKEETKDLNRRNKEQIGISDIASSEKVDFDVTGELEDLDEESGETDEVMEEIYKEFGIE